MFLFTVSLANDAQMFFISRNIQNSSWQFLIRTVFEGIARERWQKNLIFVAFGWVLERWPQLSLCWVLLPCSWQVGTIFPLLSLPCTWPNLNFHWPGELARSTLVIPPGLHPTQLAQHQWLFHGIVGPHCSFPWSTWGFKSPRQAAAYFGVLLVFYRAAPGSALPPNLNLH